MDFQRIAALGIVGVTAGAFAWAKWRPRKFRPGHSGHCGCGGGGSDPQRSSIVYRARKGERPQVVVKMR